MAKKESFFIRGTVTPGDDGFAQTTIDLSSYVSALGKSIVKIRALEGEWHQGANSTDVPNGAPNMDGDKADFAAWQLTTQSNTGLVSLDDRTTIAKGQIWARNPDSASNPPVQVYSDSHLPQHYSEGFLVAVEDIYLGAYGGSDWTDGSDLTFSIVLECEVMQLSQSAAMALALSQQ